MNEPDRRGSDEPASTAGPSTGRAADPVTVRIELGRRMLALRDLSRMDEGKAVELDCPCEQDVNVLADGRLFARGQALAVDGKFAVRVQEVLARTNDPVVEFHTASTDQVKME